MTAWPEFFCGCLLATFFCVLFHRAIVLKLERDLDRQRKIGAELHRDLMEARRERERADWWKTN